jgi:hypothetical protein
MALKVNLRFDVSDGLCFSCMYFNKVIGARGEVLRTCNEVSFTGRMGGYTSNIPFKVDKCSTYCAQTAMTLREMKQIAFILENKKGGSVGFVSSKEWRKKNQDDSVIPREDW